MFTKNDYAEYKYLTGCFGTEVFLGEVDYKNHYGDWDGSKDVFKYGCDEIKYTWVDRDGGSWLFAAGYKDGKLVTKLF